MSTRSIEILTNRSKPDTEKIVIFPNEIANVQQFIPDDYSIERLNFDLFLIIWKIFRSLEYFIPQIQVPIFIRRVTDEKLFRSLLEIFLRIKTSAYLCPRKIRLYPFAFPWRGVVDSRASKYVPTYTAFPRENESFIYDLISNIDTNRMTYPRVRKSRDGRTIGSRVSRLSVAESVSTFFSSNDDVAGGQINPE